MASADERARGETFVLERAGTPIDFTTVLLGFASSALVHGRRPTPSPAG